MYFPGVLGRIFGALGPVLPRTWTARLLHSRWHAAQKKWLPAGK
jgi:hypothetical protein